MISATFMTGATPKPAPGGRIARTGTFELDVDAGQLRRSGRLLPLTGQPMRVLILLVERAGLVVTRDELRREIWGDETHVDFDAGLFTYINQIRTALGDSGHGLRVANAFTTMHVLDDGQLNLKAAGYDYAVLVQLASLGGPVLVHLKLVDQGGWVRWECEREVTTVAELLRTVTWLAEDSSKRLLSEFSF